MHGTGGDWTALERMQARERLERYADSLVQQGGAAESPDEFVCNERPLCEDERRYQLDIQRTWEI